MPVNLTGINLIVDESYFNLSVNGQKLDLDYRTDFVFGTTRQTKEVAFEDSDLVFVGYGVNAPEYEWNDYKVDVKGKTVVMLINDPGFEIKGTEFNGKAMTYYGRWTYKFEEAARQGAAGVLIIHETAPASYPWGVVENGWSGEQLNLTFADQNLNNALILNNYLYIPGKKFNDEENFLRIAAKKSERRNKTWEKMEFGKFTACKLCYNEEKKKYDPPLFN